MRSYTKPLRRRLTEAAQYRERYQGDPAFRLAEINRKRAYMGLPPVPSLAELPRRGGWNRKERRA
jgi:hypothetical protein